MVKDFAESIPMYPGLPAVYALDICQSGDDLYVLEVGNANLAGLYECDAVKVLGAIAEETENKIKCLSLH
jgi:glutathione synthase/RimK-type ligase-like ATP-grasp enzyme